MKTTAIIMAMSMLAVAGQSRAANADTLATRTVEQGSALLELRSDVFGNPAMQAWHFGGSLNTLSAGFSHRSASAPMRLEDGKGHNLGFGHIDAYLKKGKATLWGAADYRNGTTRDIRFCETSDYAVVAPYVMADTVGGNSKRERYHFKGGFAYPVGRFTIGAEGEYSALMEYRTRDPRPKNLVGDLRGKIGATLLLDRTHIVGLALTARKYKQTNEVEIYNEVSMPVMYQLTGLGTDYYRFRGDHTETYYKGWAVGGMMTFAQTDNNGLFAQVGADRLTIDKIISSLNQLPMTTTETNKVGATLGYTRGNAAGSDYGVSAYADYTRRNGTENIFGSAQDNIYPQISSAQQYRLTLWNAGLRASMQRNIKAQGYAITIAANYSRHDERYAEPSRQLRASALATTLQLQGHATTGRMLLSAKAAGSYAWSLDSRLDVPDDAAATALLEPTTHYYAYLAENRWHTDMTIEAAYNTKRSFMPFVSLAWQYAHYAMSQHQQLLQVAVGVRF